MEANEQKQEQQEQQQPDDGEWFEAESETASFEKEFVVVERPSPEELLIPHVKYSSKCETSGTVASARSKPFTACDDLTAELRTCVFARRVAAAPIHCCFQG